MTTRTEPQSADQQQSLDNEGLRQAVLAAQIGDLFDDKPPVTVYPDPIRGHIALATDGPADATFVDLGDGHLSFWSHASGRVDTSGARALAAALTAWADRQDAR